MDLENLENGLTENDRNYAVENADGNTPFLSEDSIAEDDKDKQDAVESDEISTKDSLRNLLFIFA